MIEKAIGVGGTMVLPTGVALLQSEYVAYVEMNLVLYGGLCAIGGLIVGLLARYVLSVCIRRYKEAEEWKKIKGEVCE